MASSLLLKSLDVARSLKGNDGCMQLSLCFPFISDCDLISNVKAGIVRIKDVRAESVLLNAFVSSPNRNPQHTNLRPFGFSHSSFSSADGHGPWGSNNRRIRGHQKGLPGTAVVPCSSLRSGESQGLGLNQEEGVIFTVKGDSEGGSARDSEFNWLNHWYPVSLLEDLDPTMPTAMKLLARDIVIWRDKEGQWRCFSNLCPHRLAPLSEGRIDEQGFLQCSYHGWSFRSDGSCAVIPQASISGPEARACNSPRACASAYPTLVSQGLLFVWPEAGKFEEAARKKPVKLPPQFTDPMFSTVTIQRDLFYGYDTLMENVSDPSHIDFAHHNVTGRRERAKPLQFQVRESGPLGFEGETANEPRISSTFSAPVALFSKIELNPVLPLVGRQEWELWICSFNIPMAPGQTRSIVCSARNFARISMPGDKWWQLYPRWLEHLTSNKIYDGDMIVLQGQEKAFHVRANGDEAAAQREYGRLTYTPTGADRFVLAFRNWLRRYGGGQPAWMDLGQGLAGRAPPPSTVLSKREMLDRLSQHTEKCSSCRVAYKNVQRAGLLFGTLAVLLLASASLPDEFALRCGLAAAGVISAAVSAFLKLVLEPKFVFVDYVHAHVK